MQHDGNGRVKLSRRERQILSLIADGLRYKEVAGELGISASTVASYICELHLRLKINSNNVLIALVVSRPEVLRGDWFEPTMPSVRDFRRVACSERREPEPERLIA